MFTTTVGTAYESHNLRRDFRKVTTAAGLGNQWVPKELRTSFVSMMSYQHRNAACVKSGGCSAVFSCSAWLSSGFVSRQRESSLVRRRAGLPMLMREVGSSRGVRARPARPSTRRRVRRGF